MGFEAFLYQLVEIVLPVPLAQGFSYRFQVKEGAGEDPGLQPGDLVVVPFGRRREVTGLVVGVDDLAPDVREIDGVRLRDITRVLPAEYRITGDRIRLAQWLAGYYALPLGEVIPLFHPPSPGTRTRGGGRESSQSTYPSVDPDDITLNSAQELAVQAAERVLGSGSFGALLLHGVTGSGKTEVYLNVISRALAAGRSAIYLLPEIALTPQTLSRISARFGDRVAAIHSGLSAGQRCRVHEQAARGEI